LDHELDDQDHQAVEAHLAFCRRCCGELEFAKHLRRLLAARGTTELPAEVRARLDRFVDDLAEIAPEGGTP
jgi:anti-sigma factor RsiW